MVAEDRRPPGGRGLIEVVVGLAIVGVAVGAAAPAWVGWRDRQQLRASGRSLAAAADGARLGALRDGRSRGLIFDGGPAGGWRLVVDGDGDGVAVADVVRGDDPVLAGPTLWGPGVTPARDGRGPGGGSIPVDGVSLPRDLLSMTARGTTSSGTVYLQGRSGARIAVRWYGATGRPSLWLRSSGTDWRRLR